MPVAEANALLEKCSKYELSMTSDGKAVPKKVEAELAIWEKALPKKGKFKGRYLSSVTAEPRPTVGEDVDKEEIAKRAERVSTNMGRHHK